MPFSFDIIVGLFAFIFTVAVFSYLLGDQIFFRIAIYIFVGVSAGYVASVAWHYVLVPQLIAPLSGNSANSLTYFSALLLILLLFKAFPATSRLGTPAVAFMVGVGTATAIGGAVLGTIMPQVLTAINSFDLIAAAERGSTMPVQFFEALLMLLGTVSTLAYFQFTARRTKDGSYKRNPITRILSLIGGIFIAVTFGVIFAGIYSAALTALIERLNFLIQFVLGLFN